MSASSGRKTILLFLLIALLVIGNLTLSRFEITNVEQVVNALTNQLLNYSYQQLRIGREEIISSSISSLSHDYFSGALEHVLARRQAYVDAGALERWRFRGIGYLYAQKGLILQASLPSPSPRPGRNVVEIHHATTGPTTVKEPRLLVGTQCELLVMWVRVLGPEIFAGRAQAIKSNTGSNDPCHWEFSFDLRVPGDYHIDVKVLSWNPNTIVKSYQNKTKLTTDWRKIDFTDRVQCPFSPGGPESVNASQYVHEGIMGFKFYDPVESCCEICSRQTAPYCKHWATPPDYFDKPDRKHNGCELYFFDESPTTDDLNHIMPPSNLLPNRTKATSSNSNMVQLMETLPGARTGPDKAARSQRRRRRRRLGGMQNKILRFHGGPHSNPTTYFLGCGWSVFYTLDFPCLSGHLDDRVHVVQPSFAFVKGQAETEPGTAATAVKVRATIEDKPRQEPAPRSPQPSNPTQLPLCTLDHESLDVSTSGGGRWVQLPFPNNTVCPQAMEPDPAFRKNFDLMQFDPLRPHCWHRDDLSRIGHRCIEINCNLIRPESKWISDLHETMEWYGVWKPYACDYLEFTDKQLQTCITEKKITGFKTNGASIASGIRIYLDQRLKHISLYKSDDEHTGEDNRGRGHTVTISTLALVHQLPIPDDRHDAIIASSNKLVEQAPNADDEFYWVTGFFITSERCVHCQLGRMERMNHFVNKTLRGDYKMINAFDMSAAFTYDTASQFDGLHIIGPPMKMMVTKIFHHMCKDTVEGSRVGSIV